MYNLVKLITRLIYFRNKIDDHRYLKDILKLITALLSAVLFTYLYCLFLWIKNIFAFELEIKLPLAILILSLFFLGLYYLIVVKYKEKLIRSGVMDNYFDFGKWNSIYKTFIFLGLITISIVLGRLAFYILI